MRARLHARVCNLIHSRGQKRSTSILHLILDPETSHEDDVAARVKASRCDFIPRANS